MRPFFLSICLIPSPLFAADYPVSPVPFSAVSLTAGLLQNHRALPDHQGNPGRSEFQTRQNHRQNVNSPKSRDT